MAVFVCRDTATTYKVYDENFATLYSGTLTGGVYWFACDQDNECFYVSENAVLKKRSLANGDLIATEFESVGAQKPIIVDSDGYLWTIDNTPSNTIRKWASDLSSRTDYTIKAGVIDDYISNMVMTYDGNYVYIAGGHGTAHPSENDVKIAKLAIDDLTGDVEWEIELFHIDTYYFYIKSLAVDGNNDLYICGWYWDATAIARIQGSTGTVFWENEGNDPVPLMDGWAQYTSTWGITFYISYSQGTQSIYAFYYGNDFVGYFKQYRASDGSLIGSSVGYSGYIPTCVAVYDDDLLFAGTTYKTTLNGIYTFDITDDWGESEAASTSALLIKKPIYAAGDPTGYLNSLFEEEPEIPFEAIDDELAIRLQDAERKTFPDPVKLKALSVAQLQLVKYLESNFVPELQVIDSDLDCSGGEIALSSLTYGVLKSREGILAVKVTIDETNYWAVEIGLDELERLENEYFYADDEVFFYVQASTIKIVAKDLTGATANVYYVKIPSDWTVVYESPDLPTIWNNLIFGLAEKYCWYIEGRYDRANTVKSMVEREVSILNRKYQEEQQLLDIGIYVDD